MRNSDRLPISLRRRSGGMGGRPIDAGAFLPLPVAELVGRDAARDADDAGAGVEAVRDAVAALPPALGAPAALVAGSGPLYAGMASDMGIVEWYDGASETVCGRRALTSVVLREQDFGWRVRDRTPPAGPARRLAQPGPPPP